MFWALRCGIAVFGLLLGELGYFGFWGFALFWSGCGLGFGFWMVLWVNVWLGFDLVCLLVWCLILLLWLGVVGFLFDCYWLLCFPCCDC